MKNLSLIFAFILAALSLTQAQDMEFDFSIGLLNPQVKFHHHSELNIDNSRNNESNGGMNLFLGVSRPIFRNSFYLKTEIGFLEKTSYVSAIYTYDFGVVVENVSMSGQITNNKMALGLMPEYRYKLHFLTLKLSAGPFVSSDIVNTIRLDKVEQLKKSKQIGFKMAGGVKLMWNKIGVEFSMAFAKFGKSRIKSYGHPRISYDMKMLSCGIVYAL